MLDGDGAHRWGGGCQSARRCPGAGAVLICSPLVSSRTPRDADARLGEDPIHRPGGAEEQKGAMEGAALGNPSPHRHVFGRGGRRGAGGRG
jgi:hypothetical protein